MQDANEHERAALEAVARRFSATWAVSRTPSEASLTLSGKRIAVAVRTLERHGAGGAHVAHPVKSNIVNPSRLDDVRANDVCIQCHSQGRPVKNGMGGQYYDWPVGFHMGLKLSDHWTLEEHKIGELSFTHFPDGTAHKNRMQGNDFVQSLMYARGVTCL